MKAVQYSEYGTPDILRFVEIDAPHAGPGQIRITVKAAGVNPLDWKLRSGLYRDFMPIAFPSGVGAEAAGIVDEVGDGVSDVSIGDAVFGLAVWRTAMAEQAVLTRWARMPDGMSFEVAGALPIIAESATRILDLVSIESGETLLVAGAAGGVGTAVIQLARHRGVTVIGTASAPKHGYLRELGAIPTTYEPGLSARIRELAPQGVDAALDLAGAGNIPELVEIVGNGLRVLSIADIDAPKYGALVTTSQGEHPEIALANVARLYAEGTFRLPIERTFPFERIAEAQERSSTGRVAGKLVIAMT
ncbi:NADP-dependent oxidoreductase [Methylobacterium marchantiae]|uniref:NADP-dependent oxidoreductase n=1 Tax=Methylobacterium marchantiae TaxID=600331 RepID=A0ABW3X564_9HYPH|nr:Narbonolide/10-deoxymethynolide synthase PikA2, modules 3 and 4 [Methylobacterium marchantiae]